MLATAGTADIVLVNVFFHILLRPGIHRTLNLDPMLFHIGLNQLICTEALLTGLAIHEWIRKTAQMAGSHPGLGIHQNGTVYSYIVRTFLNKLLPPGLFHIILKLHPQIPVIPGIGKSTVNLRTRIHKSSALCQCNYLI